MAKATIDGLLLDQCQSCGGTWYDRGELDSHLRKNPGQDFATERPPDSGGAQFQLDDLEPVYLKCPHCKGIMQRSNYRKVSGVMVDVCMHHGVFLDAGELARIRAFIDSHRTTVPVKPAAKRAVPGATKEESWISGSKLAKSIMSLFD